MKNKNKKGFTLTELIVVIVIIGILAAVLIPTLTGYIKKANESADEQEVASLNQLLLDAKINQTAFNDALEVKEYLKDEMEYSGDYDLRVEGNYLWFDTKEVKFVIVGEKEVAELAAASGDYQLVSGTEIKTPEGLLKSADGTVLWLMGGKGTLSNVVSEIRNLGNTGENLTEFADLKEGAVKELFKDLFKQYGFVGSKGTFVIAQDGTVTSYDPTINTEVEILFSDKTVANVELFHQLVILANINEINEKLAVGQAPVKLVPYEEGYGIEVVLTAAHGITNAATSVLEVINILKEEGCNLGFIMPKAYGDVNNYQSILSQICVGANQSELNNYVTISEYLYGYISESTGADMKTINLSNLTKLYKVDLVNFDTSNSTSLNETVSALLFALNLVEVENGDYKYHLNDCTIEGANTFKDKNEIRLFGNVESAKYGNITIQYDFKFTVAIE